MNQKIWTEVDGYITQLFIEDDPVLNAALKGASDGNLPEIQVTPNQGKLLTILAKSINARSILEIGTLGGYSTIWLARGLKPGGKLITLEADLKHAEIARTNISRAGLADVVEVRVGLAQDTLPLLEREGRGPFDLVFIDADKPGYTAYLEWAIKLTRPGSLVIADNVIRNGAVVDSNSLDVNVQGVRNFTAALAAEPRLTSICLQTVGSKGYDGFAIAIVIGE